MTLERVNTLLAGLRLAIGVAAACAPNGFARVFGLRTEGHVVQPAFVRAFAVREIMMGAAQARATGSDATEWVRRGVPVDVADAAGVALAVLKGQAGRRALLFSATALGAAALGVAAIAGDRERG